MATGKQIPLRTWYTAEEAATYAGLTIHMVNYLCRTRIVLPTFLQQDNRPGRGARRKYSFGDIVSLRLVARLCAAGISVLRLKKGLLSLRKHHPAITLTSLPASHIVTDGKDLYLREKGESLERLIDGQLTFAFVVELSQLRKEVMKNIRAA